MGAFGWKNLQENILRASCYVLTVSYRIDTEAVGACDAERVIFICKDDDVWNWVDT